MRNELVIIGIIILFICIGFSGCNQISEVFLKDEDRILGAWNTEGILMEVPLPNVIVFFANGTFEINIEIGTGDVSLKNGIWEINNGILTLEMSGEITIPLTNYSYVFSDDSKKLTITEVDSSKSFVLTKQQGM
ncbi:MAG: hypothetical protein JW840_09925 [Candidatus Thermoplasmatota archaeon]|nr:hypothetical protein [Candidatus Thermoplasmatota archaeon]